MARMTQLDYRDLKEIFPASGIANSPIILRIILLNKSFSTFFLCSSHFR